MEKQGHDRCFAGQEPKVSKAEPWNQVEVAVQAEAAAPVGVKAPAPAHADLPLSSLANAPPPSFSEGAGPARWSVSRDITQATTHGPVCPHPLITDGGIVADVVSRAQPVPCKMPAWTDKDSIQGE